MGEPALAFGRVGSFGLSNMVMILRMPRAVMLQVWDKVVRNEAVRRVLAARIVVVQVEDLL